MAQIVLMQYMLTSSIMWCSWHALGCITDHFGVLKKSFVWHKL